MAKENIMIVEDEAIVGKELRASMEGLGYTVTSVVKTGEKALEKAVQDRPNLILMDIQLKGQMDGIKAAELIRARLDIPVIFLTAHVDDKKIERAKLTMPFGYILKPFQDKDLKVTIEMGLYAAKINAKRREAEEALQKSHDELERQVEKRTAKLTSTNKRLVQEIDARKQTEKELRESEEKFIKFFKLSPSGMVITSLEDGECFDLNESFTRITGYSRKESVGLTSNELGFWTKPEDRLRITEMLREHGSFFQQEFAFRHKSGEIRIGLFSGGTINLEGKPCIFTSIEDITDRIYAEEQYRTIIQTAIDGFQIVSAQGDFLEVNDACCEILGYRREELLQMNISDIEAIETTDELATHVQRAIKKGSDIFETKNRRKDGTIIDVQINLQFLNLREGVFIVFIKDISEKIQAKKALEKSELWMRCIFNSLQESVLVVTPDRELLDVNKAAKKMFGYSKDELIGLSAEVLHVDRAHYLEFVRRIKEAFDVGKVASFEFELKRRNGEIFPTEQEVSLLKDDLGESIGMVSVVRDITDRNLAEKALKRNEASLAEVQRIAHLGSWDWDIDNNELLWSDEVYRIFGLSPQEFELSSEGFLNCVHPDDLEFVKKSVDKTLKEKIPYNINHRIVLPTGEERIVHERAEVIYDETDRPIRMIGTVQDVTEYKTIEERLRKRNNEIRFLNDLIHQATMNLSLDNVVKSAFEGIDNTVQSDLTMFFLRKDNKLILQGVSPENSGLGTNEIPEFRVGECLCGLAVSEGKPQYSLNVNSDSRCTWEECKKAGLNSFAALPLHGADSIIGVLGFASFEERDFSEQAAFLETLAGEVAIGMQNALFYDNVRLHSDQLKLQVKERTAQLQATNEQLRREIRERKHVEERIEHVNAVLAAIHNISQLIVRENDRDKLIEDICKNLIETRGYHNAWIVLLDKKGVLATYAEAGLGKKFQPLVEQLKHGKFNDCGQRALSQPGVVLTQDPVSVCVDCPLSKNYAGRGGITVRLEYVGEVYGLLCASVPLSFINDEQEQILFEEIAGDIGFALRSIDLENEGKRAVSELQRHRDQLEELVKARTAELVIKNRQLRQEIDERKRGEEQIRRSKDLLQLGFDAISEPLIMLDEDMKIEMLNKHAAKYYGIDVREVFGKQCHQAFKGRSSPCEECIVPSTFLTGQLANAERIGFMDNDRSEDITAFPLQNNQKLPRHVVLRISDITEKKKIQYQLIRADRMSSLGQLSGGIAHEIRNPLAGISLFVDILADKEKFDRTAKEIEILDEIRNNIDKTDGIIKRILDFAKPAVTKAKSKIDLNRLIRDEIKLWSMRTREAGINLNLVLEEGLPPVSGDPIELRQVMNNLIQNAIEAMEKKGVLHIISRKGLSSFHKDRRIVIIEIKDSGPGIDPKHRENIFNPFFTTKASGTGLGLAISHQIIKRHSGIISCESEPGKGTTFTIELPAVGEEIK